MVPVRPLSLFVAVTGRPMAVGGGAIRGRNLSIYILDRHLNVLDVLILHLGVLRQISTALGMNFRVGAVAPFFVRRKGFAVCICL